MIIFRAAWVCPIAQPPIENGWVAVADGRIFALGAASTVPRGGSHLQRDMGAVAILPGLVNAHTHLELSWLRGQVPPAVRFVDWIKQLILRRGGRFERADDAAVVEPARQGAREAREMGTALVGDISNSLASVEPIASSGLRAVVFHELLGFQPAHAGRAEETTPARVAAAALATESVRISLAPHAPYSVSPELFRAIRACVTASHVPITSVHVGESESEIQLLADGSGPWPGMLRLIGAWRDDWTPPACGPVEYLDALGVLDARTLVVHGVQLGERSLERLAEIGCTLVTCPRSNQWVGAGVPPIERFYKSGVRVAVGTDSLASVDDLNVFSELKTMRWLAPSVPARELLRSATLAGAQALGFDDELGSIEPGKCAELLAVDVPRNIVDVEEYIVNGIAPRQIHWLPVQPATLRAKH